MKLIVQTLQKINWAHLHLESDLESRGLLNAEIEVKDLIYMFKNLVIYETLKSDTSFGLKKLFWAI